MRTGCFHVGYVSLSAEMSTAMKLLAGRPLGASMVVVALCVSAIGLVARGVVERQPRRAVGDRAVRHAGGDGGVLERQPAVRIETRVDDRVHRGQVDAA